MTTADADTTPATDQHRPAQLADESELDEFVAGAETALVEFYTNGCGLCQSMEPVVGNVGRELGIDIGFVNPRDDPPLIERFDVRRVPLLVLFVDGEPVARRDDGFVPGEELAAWIREESENCE
ncbi:conjugal transfer protein TraF [Halovenus sp. WSH3]|uniref:Conjugal transfer protein TraF n=1 Tax=Halovenus carboxidivorans TaxID=2692199 RepID=A0A6B0SYF6_9EURY|nr:thioredoxin family protein [Halovenus carboxidivorans]MXR50798.1 conjugal transfer protein TraF [Halovenus carboxidivorans]